MHLSISRVYQWSLFPTPTKAAELGAPSLALIAQDLWASGTQSLLIECQEASIPSGCGLDPAPAGSPCSPGRPPIGVLGDVPSLAQAVPGVKSSILWLWRARSETQMSA